jgi:acyl carrier protein
MNFNITQTYMELNVFLKNFASQFDDTPLENFQPDTRFRDLEEWDSLTALSIIAMVDEEYNQPLSGDELRGVNTIEELFELIKMKE